MLADIDTVHESGVKLYISADGSTYTELVKESTGIYSATLTKNGEYALYHLHGGESDYEALGTYKIPIYNANGEVEVYHYSVNYHTVDGALTNADESYRTVHLQHEDATVISEIPTQSDHIFTGWNTKVDGSGTDYAPNAVIPDLHERQDLYAQWVNAADVYVNVTIDHESDGTWDDSVGKDSITLTVLGRDSSSAAYHDLENGTLTLTNASHAKHTLHADGKIVTGGNYDAKDTKKTEYKASAATLMNLPGGDSEYTVTTQKTGYNIKSITPTKNSDGDWVVDVVLEFAPINVDLTFSVSMDEAVPQTLYPDAVIAKVTYYNTETGTWDYLQEQEGSGTGVRVNIDPTTGTGSGVYSVWKQNPTTSDPYGYRFEIVSFLYPDGTTLTTAAETTEGMVYTDDIYTATLDPVTGGQKFGSTFDGAYFDAFDTQKGTLHAVITIDLHDVIFHANHVDATINGSAAYTLRDQYAIPMLSDYVPVHENGNWLFDGWYLEEACSTAATEGTNIDTDVHLYAKWIPPLTVKGDIQIAGTYQLDGQTIVIDPRDRADKALILLEEVGVMGEIQEVEVTFTYGSDGNGTASYAFEVPYSAKQYEILTRGAQNYAVTFDQEPQDHVYQADENDALFHGDNIAIVNIKMDWQPDTYVQELIVDADEIGEGFRPTQALAVLYGRDIDDDHAPDIIAQHDPEQGGHGGLLLALNKDLDGNGKAAEDKASEAVWKYHVDSSRYEYTVDVPKLFGTVDGVYAQDGTYDVDAAPFYIEFSDAAAWSIAESEPMGGDRGTGVLKATLYPNKYTVTFDLNAGDDTVTGMDSYKQTDENGTVTYETEHTWSYDTAISAVPARQGYTFLGWTCETDGAYDETNKKVPAAVHEDITLRANWVQMQDIVNVTVYIDNDSSGGGTASSFDKTLTVQLTQAVRGSGADHVAVDGKVQATDQWHTEATDSTVYKEYNFDDKVIFRPFYKNLSAEYDYGAIAELDDYYVFDRIEKKTQNADGSYTHDVEIYLVYNPDLLTITYTVEVEADVPAKLVPTKAIAHVTCWYDAPLNSATNQDLGLDWNVITQHWTEARTITIDPATRKGSDAYPVWQWYKNEGSTQIPYYYRFEVTKLILADGTEIPLTESTTAPEVTYTGSNYTSTVSVENGVLATDGTTASSLQGVYGSTDNSSNLEQQGTLKATIALDTYEVTLDPNDGTIPGCNKDTVKVIDDLVWMPDLSAYTPTRDGHTFAGWKWTVGAEISAGALMTENVTLTAEWTTNTYTVTWVDDNGTTVLEQDLQVPYGTTPTYNGNTPTKAATAEYTYEFTGWTPAVVTVTGDVTYTAQYKETARTYTVKWDNDDNTNLETDENVSYGTMPTYNGNTPTKAATAEYSYEFAGWTPTVVAVTGDAVYTATYTPKKKAYTVTWLNEDGSQLEKDENVEYGAMPHYDGATPTKAATAEYSYEFAGWIPTVVLVTGDATYTATYTPSAQQIDYTVEYWYDHADASDPEKFVRDDSMTETNTAAFGDVIDVYHPLRVKENYLLDHTEGLPLTIGTVAENNVIRFYYTKDAVGGSDGGDNVPDLYQKPVTFHIVNGTWGGSAAPITTYVTLCNGLGEYDVNGSGALVVPINMQPFEGYASGAWDVTPPDTVRGTEPAEFTFRYRRAAMPSTPSNPSEDTPIPPTGDGNELYYFSALALMSLIGLGVLQATDSRRKRNADHH